MSKETRFILSAVVLAGVGAAVTAAPLGTAFTYQGLLNDAGSPVDGTADFEFRLFDAASAGSLIAGPVAVSTVDVVEGMFTATVDFGAPAFSGDARWLEIALRSPAGNGTFTTLTERQPLTAAPYSRFAANAGAAPWAGLTGVPAGFADGIDNGSGDGHSLDAADGSPTDVVFVNPAGSVGIGTTAPQSLLDVRGGIVSQVASGNSTNYEMKKIGALSSTNVSFALSHRSNGVEGWMYGYDGTTFKNFQGWDFANNRVKYPATGNTLLVDMAVGKVGVGTFAPVGGLHVNAEPLTYGGTLTLEGTTHTYIAFFPDGVAAGRKGFFGFPSATTSSISLYNEMPGGDIVLTPGTGGVVSVPVLEITGADLAEKFPTSDKVEPGMVVAIDPNNPGKLCRASGAYNRAVAGVVSGANDFSAGAILGNLPGHEDAPAIALSGRVYVWCDASTGAIRPGDLLTTSDTPGQAMKATDRERSHGAVIGKAMTSLDSGRGLVLVLVSLQ